ncbi:MAG TPA: DUF4129 domain-containing protein [Micrococcaceae bacterium]|jgi:hypothetical protein
MSLMGPVLAVPVVPGADQARQWAEQELSQQAYRDARPGLSALIGKWIIGLFTDFLNGLTGLNPNLGLVLLLVLLAALVGVAVWLARPRLNRRMSAGPAVFDEVAVLTSAEHRSLAAAAADHGDFSAAVTEQFRAMVRAAEERAVIDPRPGRTADEVTAVLGLAFPALQEPLAAAAQTFNGVRYGDAVPAAGEYRELVLLDRALLDQRPSHDDGQQHGRWAQNDGAPDTLAGPR